MKLLFVCSANQQRSPTAERLYENDPRFEVRSAGTSPFANRPVDRRLLEWADAVIVMEDTHIRQIREKFPDLGRTMPIHSLDIPDRYYYMDPDLQRQIRQRFESVYKTRLGR